MIGRTLQKIAVQGIQKIKGWDKENSMSLYNEDINEERVKKAEYMLLNSTIPPEEHAMWYNRIYEASMAELDELILMLTVSQRDSYMVDVFTHKEIKRILDFKLYEDF